MICTIDDFLKKEACKVAYCFFLKSRFQAYLTIGHLESIGYTNSEITSVKC